ncbi:MAG: ABC transporter ATP-binding protein, partial [Clostridia bacterium]|nr:ABC transporter ATP-binding protein [Clostridia bacterium]
MVFTDQFIYKILHQEVVAKYDFSTMKDFDTEIHYGSCGFYAKIDGNTTLLCRFVTGRHMPRYTAMIKACELLAERASKDPITNSEPERFCSKCGRPFIANTHYCPFCQDKKEVYRKLWAMTRGMRLMMCFPLFAAIISMIIRFVLPAVQKNAINNFITNPSIDIGNKLTFLHFIIIIAAIVMLDIVHRAVNVIQSRISAISGNKFTQMLRALLFEKIQTLSMSSIQKKSTGDLMGRINNDVTVVQHFITGLLPTYFSQLFSFILALALLIWLDPAMCLYVFIPLPIAVAAIIGFRKIMNRRNVRAWVLGQRTNHKLQDQLNGVRVIKAYGREDLAVKEFETCTENQAVQDCSNAKVFDTFFPFVGFAVRFGSYLITLFGNLALFGGTMSVGDLNQFTSYSNIIYEPLMQITAIPRNISNFATSLSKIFEILEEEPEVADIGLPLDIRIEGDVSIRNVTFGYDSYNPVLEGINLEIKQGEMVGIVGHSGCGKTTLINLIMRLYDVSEGEILIDDVNIKDISQNALRSQMGVVLQETHLFSGSIRDNIKYAAPHATNDEVVAAAKLANAHDFILNLPEGYNTMVGEKGFSLSGGERQRIAIARALI